MWFSTPNHNNAGQPPRTVNMPCFNIQRLWTYVIANECIMSCFFKVFSLRDKTTHSYFRKVSNLHNICLTISNGAQLKQSLRPRCHLALVKLPSDVKNLLSSQDQRASQDLAIRNHTLSWISALDDMGKVMIHLYEMYSAEG